MRLDGRCRRRKEENQLTRRFAIVGCGRVAKKHLAALAEVEGGELVAVCDSDAKAAAAFAGEAKVPAFESCDEMLRAVPNIDVVSVLVPSGYHGRVVRQLAGKVECIVVEKPLSLSTADADGMLAAVESAGGRLFVIKQNRCNPPIMALRQSVVSGRFGKMAIGTVRVRWRRDQAYYNQSNWLGTWDIDGGVFANQASHHIDMLLWMMGEVSSVQATATTRGVDVEAADTGAAILTFRDGSIGVIEATTATRPVDIEGSISILGSGGTVEIGGFFMNSLKTWQFVDALPEDERVFADHGEVPKGMGWNLKKYLEAVMDALDGRESLAADGNSGRNTVRVVEAIHRSAAEGVKVYL